MPVSVCTPAANRGSAAAARRVRDQSARWAHVEFCGATVTTHEKRMGTLNSLQWQRGMQAEAASPPPAVPFLQCKKKKGISSLFCFVCELSFEGGIHRPRPARSQTER